MILSKNCWKTMLFIAELLPFTIFLQDVFHLYGIPIYPNTLRTQDRLFFINREIHAKDLTSNIFLHVCLDFWYTSLFYRLSHQLIRDIPDLKLGSFCLFACFLFYFKHHAIILFKIKQYIHRKEPTTI